MVAVKALLDQIQKLKDQLGTVKFEYTHMISKEIAKWYHLKEDRIFTIITNGRITLTHPDNSRFKLTFDSKEILFQYLISLITLQSFQNTVKFFEIEPIKKV